MPFITSTLSNDINFKSYAKPPSGAAATSKNVLVKGGANVAQRRLVILGEGASHRSGIRTEVSDGDLAFLKENKDFQKFVASGHLAITSDKVNPEKAAKDMAVSDKSSQLTAKDSETGGRLSGNKAKTGKVE